MCHKYIIMLYCSNEPCDNRVTYYLGGIRFHAGMAMVSYSSNVVRGCCVVLTLINNTDYAKPLNV